MQIGGSGAGLPMAIRLYLPTGPHGPGSLPCVIIAPAGSGFIHGMVLAESDTPESLPYVRAGFAVVAYELSGNLEKHEGQKTTYGMMRGPVKQFMAADGGCANARNAVNFVLASVPEVDPARLFAAGHSSAATMALNAVASDHRFRAVAAYAPRCDVLAVFSSEVAKYDKVIPGTSALMERVSPIRHIDQITCPVLLFHADDDSLVPTSDNQAFADTMKSAGRQIEFKRVPNGDHYDSMIREGIPAGIAFFQARPRRLRTPPRKTPFADHIGRPASSIAAGSIIAGSSQRT